MTLKISFSGVRGTVNGSLTDEVVADFAAAFARYIGGGTVVVGSDTRASGDHMGSNLAAFTGLTRLL